MKKRYVTVLDKQLSLRLNELSDLSRLSKSILVELFIHDFLDKKKEVTRSKSAKSKVCFSFSESMTDILTNASNVSDLIESAVVEGLEESIENIYKLLYQYVRYINQKNGDA